MIRRVMQMVVFAVLAVAIVAGEREVRGETVTPLCVTSSKARAKGRCFNESEKVGPCAIDYTLIPIRCQSHAYIAINEGVFYCESADPNPTVPAFFATMCVEQTTEMPDGSFVPKDDICVIWQGCLYNERPQFIGYDAQGIPQYIINPICETPNAPVVMRTTLKTTVPCILGGPADPVE